MIGELARVLTPDGQLGLLVHLRTVDDLADEPEGNHFPSGDELDRLLAQHRLDVRARVLLHDLPDADQDWDDRAGAVESAVADSHHDDPRWANDRQDEDRVGRLISDGSVEAHLLVLRRLPG